MKAFLIISSSVETSRYAVHPPSSSETYVNLSELTVISESNFSLSEENVMSNVYSPSSTGAGEAITLVSIFEANDISFISDIRETDFAADV